MLACTAPEDVAPCTDDTWTSFAEPLFRTWCTSCHSVDLTGDARHGAPADVDLDTLDAVALHADRIAARATGPSPTMPPISGPTEDERERLAAWLECDLPGSSTPLEGVCDDPVPVEALDASCAVAQRVTGDLDAAGELPCLCAVDGTLRVTADLEAPAIETVGGDLVVEGGTTVALPGLRVVGGSVRADGATQLDALLLGELATVGGDLALRDGGPRVLDLSALQTITGSVAIERMHTLQDLRLTTSLQSVGGDLVLDGLWSMALVDGFGRVQTVAGDVLVRDTPVAVEVFGLQALREVGGNARFESFPAATRAGPAPDLEVVDGDVHFVSLPAVANLETLALLVSVGGTLSFEQMDAMADLPELPVLAALGGLRVADLPVLGNVARFDLVERLDADLTWQRLPALASTGRWKALASIGGQVTIEDIAGVDEFGTLPVLTTAGGLTLRRVDVYHLGLFDAIVTVDGDLVLEDLDAIVDLTGLEQVATVTGSVVIRANDALADLSQVAALVSVGGDLVVEDNPLLDGALAEAFVAGIAYVGGERRAEGNGP